MLNFLPCIDSVEMAESRKWELRIPRREAAMLGRTAVEAANRGYYKGPAGTRVTWGSDVDAARTNKTSIPESAPLPERESATFPETRVQVTNETTLGASRRLVEKGLQPLALNFANGVSPGGGFLNGALAQEEVLCRSSALYQTLVGDAMYTHHRQRPEPDSTGWLIHSPGVPVFRNDDGTDLERPWNLSFITCAAPYAPSIGQPRSRELLRRRIHRVLEVSRAYGCTTLVLGAWGCGAFGNDPHSTAIDYREALENEFSGSFSEIVFAITDWSADRRYLGPFRKVFSI